MEAAPGEHDAGGIPMKRLGDRAPDGGGRELVFVEELRVDFVGAALTVHLEDSRRVEWIEFYDTLGVMRWRPGQPMASRSWDDPEMLGGWVKHFGVPLLNGSAPNRPGMVESVLRKVEKVDAAVASFVRAVMSHPERAREPVPVELLGELEGS
jgi:hypothetical protein